MPGIGIAIGVPFSRSVSSIGTKQDITDELSVEFTLTTWRLVIDGSNNVLIQNKVLGVWTTVDTWYCLNAGGGWKFNIDGSNNLSVQNDDGGYADVVSWTANSGTAWRFAIVSGDLEVQELIGSTWTKNSGWTAL